MASAVQVQGEATLGIRTIRGDFERALVGEVVLAMQAACPDDLTAGPFLVLMTVEDAAAMQSPLVGRKERA